jgi:hypothetical protein
MNEKITIPKHKGGFCQHGIRFSWGITGALTTCEICQENQEIMGITQVGNLYKKGDVNGIRK